MRFSDIMPPRRSLPYGIQPVVHSEVLVGDGADFQRIVDDHPEMQKFFFGSSSKTRPFATSGC